jgi:hypothetical protein
MVDAAVCPTRRRLDSPPIASSPAQPERLTMRPHRS